MCSAKGVCESFFCARFCHVFAFSKRQCADRCNSRAACYFFAHDMDSLIWKKKVNRVHSLDTVLLSSLTTLYFVEGICAPANA